MVCFRYIIVNNLHKGDNKDNNNNNAVMGAIASRATNINENLTSHHSSYVTLTIHSKW